MSLKKWVNDKTAMDDFIKHLDDLIYIQHNTLEQADIGVDIHRAQGAIQALKRLKMLRETVNG
jgi:flagellar biosynthesis chaperone FliJ